MDTQDGFYYLMEASANMEYSMLSCESGTANLMITGMDIVQNYYEQQLEAMPQIYATSNTHHNTYAIDMGTSITFAGEGIDVNYGVYTFDDPGFVSDTSSDGGTTIQQDDEETQECAQAVNQYYENGENSYQSVLQSQQTLVQQTSTNSQAFVQFEGAVIQVFSYAANLLAAAL